MYCILPSQPVNLPLMILNIMIVDNNACRSLPFGMVLIRLFSHWQIEIQGELFYFSSKPFDASFLYIKMSHLFKCSSAHSSSQAEQTTHVPPHLLPQSFSDPYFILLEKFDSMALAQSRFQEGYSVDACHFAAT